MLQIIIDRILFYSFFKWHYKRQFKHYGDNVRWGPHFKRLVIPSSVRISLREKISIGDNCQFDEFVYLQCHKDGDGMTIRAGCRCNAFTHILAYSHILLKEKVLIAPYTLISSGNHGTDDLKTPIMDQAHRPSGEIVIGEGSWLGHSSKILGSTNIGENSVVAAGAIVTKGHFDKYSVIAGVPAKVIKVRS